MQASLLLSFRPLKIKRFEVKDMIPQIQQPILYMWGENDSLVSWGWCMDELNTIFNSEIPSNFQTYIAPHQNHSFEEDTFCPVPKSKRQYSEDSRKILANWINQFID